MIAVVLMLIAFTLAPIILDLITDGGGTVPATQTFLFAVAFALVLFAAHGFLKGVWKSTLPLWAILLGTPPVYIALFGAVSLPPADTALVALPENLLAPLAVPDAGGVLAAFLICYLALATNDLGSIQSVGSLLKAEGMGERVNRGGVAVTGLGERPCGCYRSDRPVNFSLSPGIIAATGCASRFALVPAAVGLGLVAASPLAIGYLESIPAPVIGVVLTYVMAAQIAAGGLMLGQESGTVGTFDGGWSSASPSFSGRWWPSCPRRSPQGFRHSFAR